MTVGKEFVSFLFSITALLCMLRTPTEATNKQNEWAVAGFQLETMSIERVIPTD